MSRNSASDLLTDPDGLVVDSDATTQTGTARAQGQIHLESAELLLVQGQKAQAVTECIAGLNAGNLPAMTVAGLVLALRGAGQMDLANHVQVLAISQLTAFVKRNPTAEIRRSTWAVFCTVWTCRTTRKNRCLQACRRSR